MYFKCGLRLRSDRLIQALGLGSHNSAIKEGTRKRMEKAKQMRGSAGCSPHANQRIDWFPSLWSAFVAIHSHHRCDRSVRPKESNINEFPILKN